MRDVKKGTPARTPFRPSCVPKKPWGLTNDSEVSSRGNRRISAHVRVVVLGVLRRTVFWAEKTWLFRRCSFASMCVCMCMCYGRDTQRNMHHRVEFPSAFLWGVYVRMRSGWGVCGTLAFGVGVVKGRASVRVPHDQH